MNNNLCKFYNAGNFSSVINQISGSLVGSPITNTTVKVDTTISYITSSNFILDGIFMKIYKTDATTIGADVINADGVVLISCKRLNVGMRNYIPFQIWQNNITIKYYDGFLYSPNDIPYSSYSTHFPSGTVFA